jgi:hypothetical protein
MDVGHRIAVDHRIRRAVICSPHSVGANDDCCVLVNYHVLVAQGLRLGGIDVASDYLLDGIFFVVWFLGTEAGDELVVKNSPKRSRVVLDLGGHPFLFEV